MICNCIKHKGVANRYRISEKPRVVNFIRAYNFFKDDVIDVLTAVHALTGCDTTSKVGTKAAALKGAAKYGFELLHLFGKAEL